MFLGNLLLECALQVVTCIMSLGHKIFKKYQLDKCIYASKQFQTMHEYISFAKILMQVKVIAPHLPFSHSKGRWHPNWHPRLSTLTKSHT
jgi:hypothetical protein